jgi:hypothetical protein
MAILELAQVGDLQLAYATYHIVQSELEQAMTAEHNVMGEPLSRSRILEQRLAALASARTKDPKAPVPDDFYNDSSECECSTAGSQQSTATTNQARCQNWTAVVQFRDQMGVLPALCEHQMATHGTSRIKWWDDNERSR